MGVVGKYRQDFLDNPFVYKPYRLYKLLFLTGTERFNEISRITEDKSYYVYGNNEQYSSKGTKNELLLWVVALEG